jgi:LuxR family maltose regulon positive regulatory protein
LLRRAHASGIAPEYAARLLSILERHRVHDRTPTNGALGGAIATPGPERAVNPRVEPLTERELAVLRLIVTGASNQEIARHLRVSVATVKGHVHHILGKLGVTSRTQAAFRARTLHFD